MKTLLVDPSRCLECSNCWVACKDEHCGDDWGAIAAKQGPDQWWIRIDESEAASGKHMKLHRVPVMCQHCAEAPCMDTCSAGAIVRRDDGIVLISPKTCTGCNDCLTACPYDAIFANTEQSIAQKCTLCAHLLDEGWERPRCVTACPNDALLFVDDSELTPSDLPAPLERLKVEKGTYPTVGYIRLPKLFVAGELASHDGSLCIEGAEVIATHQVTGASTKGYSGTFGEFHLDVNEPGFYSVTFVADGYKRKTFTDVDLRASLSLDTVTLWPLTESI